MGKLWVGCVMVNSSRGIDFLTPRLLCQSVTSGWCTSKVNPIPVVLVSGWPGDEPVGEVAPEQTWPLRTL